jgi:hypothetical protein
VTNGISDNGMIQSFVVTNALAATDQIFRLKKP